MSARRRAHPSRPLIIAAAVLVLLAIAARSASLLADTQTELARERARLAEARASAAAAWDAAADRPPSPYLRPAADARSALLAAPLSGARPLTGGRG